MTFSACQAASTPPTIVAPTATAYPATRSPEPGLDIEQQALRDLTVELWHPWLGVEASLLDAQVAKFNETNRWGITVNATGQSGYTELYNNLAAALPGDEAPQMAVALPDYAVGWAAGGYVSDLSDYINDPVYGLTEDEVKDFSASYWEQDFHQGRQLGVPAQRSAHVLLYNQGWARELGQSGPPAAAKDFREQACEAHQSMTADGDPKNDGQGGWLVDTGAMTLLSWMIAFDGGIVDGDGYRFLTPRNLESLAFIKGLYDEGCAWLLPAGDDAAAAFATRRALLVAAGLEELPEYSRALGAAGNADTWVVTAFPGPKHAALLSYGSSFVVLDSTPEKQLASWLFIRWMLSAENQTQWVEATGLLPLRASMLPLLGEYARSHPKWLEAVELSGEAQLQPELASWRQVRVMMGDGFDAMFQSNTAAGRVAEILAIMDRTASDISP